LEVVMKHEKYTCDRCNGVISGSPAVYGGEWRMSIGHQNLVKLHSNEVGHLCAECLVQVRTLTRLFWQGLWPSLHVPEKE
jgi:hypothetical protein